MGRQSPGGLVANNVRRQSPGGLVANNVGRQSPGGQRVDQLLPFITMTWGKPPFSSQHRNSRPSKLTYPSGREAEYTYDDRQLLKTIKWETAQIEDRSYNDAGMLTGVDRAFVDETRTYNAGSQAVGCVEQVG